MRRFVSARCLPRTTISWVIPQERAGKIRTKIIKSILATDMANHMEHMSNMSQRVSLLDDRPYEIWPWSDESAHDRQQLIEMTLHLADISNCCRPWNVNWRIGALLEGEFFLQGDEEKRLKLPVMPLMNRETDSLAAGQSFWIPKIVVPLVQIFEPVLDADTSSSMMTNCNNNQEQWAALVEKHGKRPAGELVKLEYGFALPKSTQTLPTAARGSYLPTRDRSKTDHHFSLKEKMRLGRSNTIDSP